MGYKNICVSCRVAFSEGGDYTLFNKDKPCPKCNEKMVLVGEKFKPPKHSDIKQWQIVKYLVENGFFFKSVYTKVERGVWEIIPYPQTLIEAEEFVMKYKNNPNVKY